MLVGLGQLFLLVAKALSPFVFRTSNLFFDVAVMGHELVVREESGAEADRTTQDEASRFTVHVAS
jgi:hypothetical protein